MPLLKRILRAGVLVTLACGLAAPAALASTRQEAIIQDNDALQQNLTGTLSTMKELGATRVKVTVYWNQIAPAPNSARAPRNFNAGDPASYPAGNWAFLDSLVREARAYGIAVGFTLTGPAPGWAVGPGAPANCATHPCGNWRPSASQFGAFVHAVGERYSGHYAGLPRVSWWSIWNEPNYGPNLAPQATNGNTVPSAAIQYRSLLSHAWGALRATGHSTRSDTILIGETAPRGRYGPGFPGNFSGTMPLIFLRSLYCVGGSLRPLRGSAAARAACPSSRARFRAQNPALFSASGYAQHPYAQGTPPNTPTYACGSRFCFNTRSHRSDPNYADLAELPRLERTLDAMNRAYGSHTRFPIWNTEYGFWTNPPSHQPGSISPSLAAYYLNWAEYLSYRQPRIASFYQYLLIDPASGSFADGLMLADGQPLAGFSAWRMPLYMPRTSSRHAAALEVWGAVRPAASALSATGLQQDASIQFQAGGRGAWQTVRTVSISNPRGYFDVRQVFTRSGNVRIAWYEPGVGSVVSRTQAIHVG